jgi:phosphoribosylformylglycinamidine cyclo-ligase
MFNTFNMGIGYVLIVPPSQAEQTIQYFKGQDLPAYRLGEVILGEGELILEGL